MAGLNENIRAAVAADRYVFSAHADQRLRERRIMAWQIVAGVQHARLLQEKPLEKPNPTVELEQLLVDGTAVKVVWAWMETESAAKLVTVHFFDR
jgi:hypothetical protein